MKHLRVETEEELEVLVVELTFAASDDDRPARSAVARRLLERLQAAPVARHGGIVHEEDANYLPTPGGRQ